MSGVSTLFADRPNGKRLFDMLREGDTLLVRWVDRLGRNYSDVRDTIQEFMRRGVVVRTVINGLTFDGSARDPMQQAVRDALIGFLAATAQSNAEAIKEAQRGGIELAKKMERMIQLEQKRLLLVGRHERSRYWFFVRASLLVASCQLPYAETWPLLARAKPLMQLQSTLTCPKCQHRATETMPTDACQFFYDCKGCGERLKPLSGDCCVFCSYGSLPCPPIQQNGKGACFG